MRDSTDDSEFERLLNASSLGAPHVTQEKGEIPPKVREKLEAAAAKGKHRNQ